MLAGFAVFVARFFGWGLLALSALLASGEAVLALGGASPDGLSTREIWVLLSGGVPSLDPTQPAEWGTALRMLLDGPAWMAMGGLGLVLSVVFRPRRRVRPHPRPRPRPRTYLRSLE
ncbi:hypothetical protein [Pararhodospirillum oryzae]|uniref:Uncharacterized protein n=1 Tax=Pararhodospirillum oryzae TaxID=478448 RepID=A0A512H3M5_9PROT|nr:hypothetical protein [Pararhodospirillum oryzae]GEO80066.1 hypothetical protein ROR02_01970 [Pararhodospirillum oryzae]